MSIQQLVSEFAHSLSQPNNAALRENIKQLIIHTRAEVIRRSYENHSYVDKGLTQRFKVSLEDYVDGELKSTTEDGYSVNVHYAKRTSQKVPKPVRLPNNLPFDRVSTVGYKTSRELPFIKEASTRFKSSLPGMCGVPSYDYINGYIYIFPAANRNTVNFNKIIIEGAFEHPTEVMLGNGETDSLTAAMDDNEWILSEDMVGQIKEIIYKRDMLNQIRQTDEIPNSIKF